jgi:hypothetical protein
MRVEVRGVTLVVRIESLADGAIVRAAVSNRSDETVRLDSIRFDLATGLLSGCTRTILQTRIPVR